VGNGLLSLDGAPAQQRLDRLGRIFDLPSFAEPLKHEAVKEALLDMGRRGGMLDAHDDLSAGPLALLTDPSLSVNNPDHPRHAAGVAFLAEFLDHDMTFDFGAGRPAFDLNTVYGHGPVDSRQLYDQQDRGKLRVENGGLFEDVPRDADRTAIVGDPRNDRNLITSQLHAAFLFAHNRALDMVRAKRGRVREEFAGLDEARRLLCWHYQWLIVHEFLPLVVGEPVVDDILRHGRRFFRPQRTVMPVEFYGAAYRFRHSLTRPSYPANLAGDAGKPFVGFLYDPAESDWTDPSDLVGCARAPRRFVGWQTFFDFGDGQLRHGKRITTHLSTPLFGVPTTLPQRTLLRHLSWSLPSGQAIARAMRAPLLSAGDLDELAKYGLGFEDRTPLFYYVLKEAELTQDGLRLGPVGGRIVGEVMLGLLQLNCSSYLASQPGWRPTLPSRSGRGEFQMVDLLTFAGVDPASRGPVHNR